MANLNENELRLRNFSPALKKDLKVVAARIGIPMASFAKSAIRKAVDSELNRLQ